MENYNKVPVIGKVAEVNGEMFTIHYWKGSWRKEWEPWIMDNGKIWDDELHISCLLLVAFDLDKNGKFLARTSQYLRKKYKSLANST